MIQYDFFFVSYTVTASRVMKKIIKKLNKNKISKARQELHKTTCIPWIFLNFFHYFLQKYHVGRFLIIFVYVPSLFLGL